MDGYNGWANYETWLISLWMDNDEKSYNYFRNIEEQDINKLAQIIEAEHTSYIRYNIPENGFIMDLLNAAMSKVNWEEIAENIIEETVNING